MNIGELAERTGVSIRSLRYYEQKGLLTPLRKENGYREYTLFAVEQVQAIQLYLNLGLSTDEISGILQCVLQNKEAFCKDVLPIYQQKLQEIDKQIQVLTSIRANLTERIDSILLERSLSGQEEG
ncbi:MULTISPECIES: MerR family transcriptional regulator [Paenibacillus]|uniref:MerR family transcriptional regulator n=1 Tax=Paenibacillus TaxID=44249 RepID=UPI0011A5537A|nr:MULTISPECIES: MerR family transcriptional regulator [Paenibacillus]MBJ9987437.1 MerR family transcriptional regulator [Paenibacillus sp. S28]